MDHKHHVRIVGQKVIAYKSKTTGAPGELRLAQCVVTSEHETKGQQVIVGELMLDKDLWETPNGEYLAEFELSVSKELRIGARLVALHPIGQSTTAPRTSSGASKDQEKKAA